MRFCHIVCVPGATAVLVAPFERRDRALGVERVSANPFVGTWRLLSFESRTAEGEVIYPLGRDAIGYIVYTEDGFMSVHLMAANRSKYTSGDWLRGTVAEKVAANDTYIAYCGRYEVQRSKVIHQAEASFFPNWVGTAQERFYELDGDRLVLSTSPILIGGATITSRLIWERARS